MKPLCIDLYCGLGGWAEGFLAAGYRVVGFDNHRHVYGDQEYHGQLVIQDVLTLHGSQFRDAAVIVASPPCQEYSYMAMPWSLAKAKAARIRADETGEMRRKLTALFDACFRIQREACEAAGRYIPLIVENVKGAQPWVGRAPWNFGSFYLWGDVPALMPMQRRTFKTVGHANKRDGHAHTRHLTNQRESDGLKVPGMNFHEHAKTGKPGRAFQSAAVEGLKLKDADGYERTHPQAFGWKSPRTSSGATSARKMASAQIAKIPFPLAEHIARVFHPGGVGDSDTERIERAV